LGVVQWAEKAMVRGKKPGEPLHPIKPYEAAKQLKITQTMLKKWIKNKARISLQKKASRRAYSLNLRARELELEHALFWKF
jgi:hypothetical protein